MKIEKNKIVVNKSKQELYDLLLQTEKLKNIFPENIEKFEPTENGLNFKLPGMPEIRLGLKEKVEGEKIVYQTIGIVEADLIFQITPQETEEQKCQAQLFFEGDINPMMSMMVKKPLNSLLDKINLGLESL